ncbi:MAG: NAD(P)H-hydrate epimerase [Myxococcales bacterium]|nr:NAD(P)H-hydrate epimerase [Myxococcales bacterium]
MRSADDLATLVSAAASARGDRYTMDELGIPSLLLMERAALAVAHEIRERFAAGREIVVLCGPGNNGGDGLAAARQLRGWGVPARVHLCTERHNDVVAEQVRLARAMGVEVVQGLPSAPATASMVVVDALLGTGARGAPRGSIAEALAWLDAAPGPRVAIDIPSGVDPDSGAVPGIAARVALTVTMGRSKPGLHITPGRAQSGEVVVAEIGLVDAPADPEREAARLVSPWQVRRLVDGLRPGAHKGERGHVAVLGGSPGTVGAAVLAGASALRAGAGLVTLVVGDPGIDAAIVGQRPELMSQVREPGTSPAPAANVLIVGPGLTRASDRQDLETLWRGDPRPAVWDASALAEIPALADAPAGPRIITPHPGEAAALLLRLRGEGGGSRAIQADRRAVARALATATGAIAVLKGEGTLIDDGERLAIAVSGGPGLATAGSGDCLTGFLAALLARGLGPWEAACAGVHLHGIAGELAEGPGAVAMDIAGLAGRALAAAPEHPRWPRLRLG